MNALVVFDVFFVIIMNNLIHVVLSLFLFILGQIYQVSLVCETLLMSKFIRHKLCINRGLLDQELYFSFLFGFFSFFFFFFLDFGLYLLPLFLYLLDFFLPSFNVVIHFFVQLPCLDQQFIKAFSLFFLSFFPLSLTHLGHFLGIEILVSSYKIFSKRNYRFGDLFPTDC